MHILYCIAVVAVAVVVACVVCVADSNVVPVPFPVVVFDNAIVVAATTVAVVPIVGAATTVAVVPIVVDCVSGGDVSGS